MNVAFQPPLNRKNRTAPARCGRPAGEVEARHDKARHASWGSRCMGLAGLDIRKGLWLQG